MLRSQLAKDGNNKKVLGPRDKDSSTMLTLTKKLQDAQKLYEKVKSDLGKVKEVIISMVNIKVTFCTSLPLQVAKLKSQFMRL